MEASGGEAAITKLQSAEKAGFPYDLVLLDCRMPDLDGFAVVEKFYEKSSLAGMTVVMLTSDPRSTDIAAVLPARIGRISGQADSPRGAAQDHFHCDWQNTAQGSSRAKYGADTWVSAAVANS